ncbi:HERV-H LTR-associating protein 2 [Amblyraja radiata]|uniref:HERV-H LTR-associating protein 2 n=1 Tax=Amblyraja radiata TaxID=386614 RepID=UPI0014024801|nr:HERV-H LTR-associating protein 2 [Amblyraja radiata]
MFLQIACLGIFGIFQLISAGTSLVAVVSTDVVLPCTFPPATLLEIVLHWMYSVGQSTQVVHSFYRGADQLGKQDPHYEGRTGLFHREIARGNASLRLMAVNIHDERLYQCYVSTLRGNVETNVNLQVAGDSKNLTLLPPNTLSVEVNISCGVTGAYPQPLITWRDENGIDLTNNATSSNTNDSQGLYNVESILKTDYTSRTMYECTIRNERLQKSWTASWKMQGTLKENKIHPAAIHCQYPPNNDQDLTIIWRFRNSETSSLAVMCESTPQKAGESSGCKKERMEVINTKNSSTLQLGRAMKEDAGEYICEIRTRDVLQIFTYVLQIDPAAFEESHKRTHYGFVAVLAMVALLIICILIIICCKNSQRS